MSVTDEIKKRRLYFDGGMGSLLQEAGLAPGELPENWNITHPDAVRSIHKSYLLAGSDIITTNTFGANSLKYTSQSEYTLSDIIKAAVDNAAAAVREVSEKDGRKKYIALDIGPTGKLLKPFGDLEFESAYEIYKEVVLCGALAGVDLIIIETMSDVYECKAAILAAKENSDLPIFATMTYDKSGKLLTGADLHTTTALLEGLGVDALGMNCGLGPLQIKDMVSELLSISSTPVIINPNAGLPHEKSGKTVYDIDAHCFSDAMSEFAAMGVSVMGGCCGTTPEHISLMVKACRDIVFKPTENKNITVVSSYSKSVVIDSPVIIGERINPTGKSKFKQALRDGDIDYILDEGIKQVESGAHILDVNVGLPEINEPDMMETVIKELQGSINLPLQIDTSDIAAMERAMRIYNGKPLVNSVNGKQKTMDEVFPLVKKYGGVVVALTLDENGIPDTADERLKVAEKIIRRASEYGIDKKNIIIDTLCMTISSEKTGALTTLEALKKVKDILGVKTILGVSNISFGLPARENINANFYTMALMCGLNAAIINPNSDAMMKAYYSFRALAALDDNCIDYISMCSQYAPAKTTEVIKKPEKSEAETVKAATGRHTLFESIEKGLREHASSCTKELLKSKKPLDIINGEMIPALDSVGKGFEKGTLFLPQLLMSAEAAKSAFDVIKDHMESLGETRIKKGSIVLATVKGDIHDIGKNIVKVLLENYSYDVIDLGKDVAPETVVKTVVDNKIKLVGLSALMTTTVPSMAETIAQLRKSAPQTKIMVGGAVMTKEYADSIGADAYCKDALASVEYAEGLFGGDHGI